MKNYILTMLIIVFAFIAVGQERNITKNPFNISSLNYYELELLRNYYAGLIKEERFNQIEKQVNVKYYGIYNVLMVMEQEVLLLLQGRYKKLLNVIKDNEVEYFSKRNERTYLIGYMYDEAPYKFAEKRFSDKLNSAMLNYVMFNEYRLKQLVSEDRSLSKADVLFIHFYIDLLIHYNDPCNKRNEYKVLDSAKELVTRFPYSRYALIAKKYKQFEYSFSDWSLGIYTPVGIEFPISKELNSYASSIWRMPFLAMGLETGFKDFLFYSDISISYYSVSTQISGFEDESLVRSEHGYSTFGVAYRFKLNDRIELQPFIARRIIFGKDRVPIDDYYLNPSNYEDIEVSPKTFRFPNVINSLSYGLALELNFGKETFCNRPFSRGYHRFQIGFSSLALPDKDRHISGNTMIFQYSIGYRLQRRKGVAWYE